jgi:hypothetical protein
MNAEQEISRLIAAGVTPNAKYVAAAGFDYGWVKAWCIGDSYVIQYGDDMNTYTDVTKDIGDLAEWLELWTLSGLDAIVQTANVRGSGAVSEAIVSNKGPFYILETRHWYSVIEISRVVMDDSGHHPLEFMSIKEARTWIKRVEDEPYWPLHNESGRPSYKVVTV